jgi:hypothetical protein
LYVVCSFKIVIELPSFGNPTPTNGPPPPGIPVPDWLLTSPLTEPSVFGAPELELLEPRVGVPLVDEPPPSVGVPDDPEDPNALDPDDEDPNPLDPNEELPKLLVPPGELPGVVPCPGEVIPAADPNPGATPLSGCPKNPFTVVFASPT